jgi:2-oxoglutarate ferredoxin oxidoreductase subunit gamma
MAGEDNKRAEVIIAGIGGQGILLTGLILAEAGLNEYLHIVWTPSYATRVRGGPCECTIILSQEEIYSPLLSRSSVAILASPFYLKPFENRVRPGGLIFIESSGLVDQVNRQDIEIKAVPAQEIALSLGNKLASNMVLLGAYVAVTNAISPASIEKKLAEKFAHKSAILSGKLSLKELNLSLIGPDILGFDDGQRDCLPKIKPFIPKNYLTTPLTVLSISSLLFIV